MNLAEVRIRSVPGGRERLLRDPNGPLGRWLASRGIRAQNAARVEANVDTGLMRSRVEFRIETDGGGLVGILAAKTAYAKWVHDGNGRYPGNPFLVKGVRAGFRQ